LRNTNKENGSCVPLHAHMFESRPQDCSDSAHFTLEYFLRNTNKDNGSCVRLHDAHVFESRHQDCSGSAHFTLEYFLRNTNKDNGSCVRLHDAHVFESQQSFIKKSSMYISHTGLVAQYFVVPIYIYECNVTLANSVHDYSDLAMTKILAGTSVKLPSSTRTGTVCTWLPIFSQNIRLPPDCSVEE